MGPTNIARTFLFVPASRPDQIRKALGTSADVVIIDLEDAVRTEDKAVARQNLAMLQPTRPTYVRINASTTDEFEDDVTFVSASPWVSAVVLPKVNSPAEIQRFREAASREVHVVALVESPSGIIECDDIAQSGVSRLMFGSVDYAMELNAPPGSSLFAYPRSRLVVASAAAGLPAPVDGPTLAIDDAAKLEEESLAALAIGMGGKLCVHPNQIATVASVFAATSSDRAWALEVLAAYEASEGGVFVVNGQMIDAPLVARARKILEA